MIRTLRSAWLATLRPAPPEPTVADLPRPSDILCGLIAQRVLMDLPASKLLPKPEPGENPMTGRRQRRPDQFMLSLEEWGVTVFWSDVFYGGMHDDRPPRVTSIMHRGKTTAPTEEGKAEVMSAILKSQRLSAEKRKAEQQRDADLVACDAIAELMGVEVTEAGSVAMAKEQPLIATEVSLNGAVEPRADTGVCHYSCLPYDSSAYSRCDNRCGRNSPAAGSANLEAYGPNR